VSLWQTILLVLGLTMDTLAVSGAIALYHERITFRLIFRVAFHFALFQTGLLFLGWGIGSAAGTMVSSYDHWLAAGLLWFIGGKMLWEAYHDHEDEVKCDPSRGWSLVFLSTATSLDALAVGGSLGFLEVFITQTLIVTWFITLAVAISGLFLGKKVGGIFGKWAERLGGVVLILIGIKVLYEHLSA
jgi:putative Mn2+ efflux pump MntP